MRGLLQAVCRLTQTIALVLGCGLAAAEAQSLWTGASGEACEVWKGNEIRCGFKTANRIRVTLTNKGASTVNAKVSFWKSVCGLPGSHEKDDALTLPPGASAWAQASFQAMAGDICKEAFVTCGSARCAEAVAISVSAEK